MLRLFCLFLIVVRLNTAEAVLSAIDAASDVEASDDDGAGTSNDSGQRAVEEQFESESSHSEDSESSSDDDIPLANNVFSKKKITKAGTKITWHKCKDFVGVSGRDTTADLEELKLDVNGERLTTLNSTSVMICLTYFVTAQMCAVSKRKAEA